MADRKTRLMRTALSRPASILTQRRNLQRSTCVNTFTSTSNMEAWRAKVALVTGASSGIGATVAVTLADAGMQVVAVARRVEQIQALVKQVRGPGKLHPRRCDVSVDSGITDLFQYIKKNFGGVDLLVNNAAILSAGTIIDCQPGKETALKDIDAQLNVNIRATVACTQHAVRSMRERNFNGHVIFINSIAGQYLPTAGSLMETSIYPATKHAVTAIAEIVRREISYSDLKIRTTSISPGAVDTDMIRQIPDLSEDMPMLKSADIAAAIVYAVSAPSHVNIQEITIHAVGEKF